MTCLSTLYVPRQSASLAHAFEAWGVAHLVHHAASPAHRVVIRQQSHRFVITITPPLDIATLDKMPFWAPLPLITDTPPRFTRIPIRRPADEWTRAHAHPVSGERPPPPDWRTVVFLADPHLGIMATYNRLAGMWAQCYATWPNGLLSLLQAYSDGATPSFRAEQPCLGKGRTQRIPPLFFLHADEQVLPTSSEWLCEYVRAVGFFIAAVPCHRHNMHGYTLLGLEPVSVDMKHHYTLFEAFNRQCGETPAEMIPLMARFLLARLGMAYAEHVHPQYTLHVASYRVPRRGSVILEKHLTTALPVLPTPVNATMQHMWSLLLSAHVAILKTGGSSPLFVAQCARW